MLGGAATISKEGEIQVVSLHMLPLKVIKGILVIGNTAYLINKVYVIGLKINEPSDSSSILCLPPCYQL